MIFNIEKFSTYDGPGIRTVVFLKGCPLRCKWCSSPESHNMFPEMEYWVDKCLKCARCAAVCPLEAITVSDSGEILTDRKLCNSCGKCVEVCPVGARSITGKEMTVEEVLKEIDKDTIFYWNSGGGVTLSGGEPLMQSNFSQEILKGCKERGIHTAIETCCYGGWDVLDSMLKYLGLVYVDIKHMSPVEHEKITGKRNELILENIRRIASEHADIPLIIRVPIILGENDSEENVVNTAKFVSQLKSCQRIELLPYHRFGVGKYKALFRDYLLPDLESPNEDHMRHLKELVESYSIEAQIEG